MTGDPVAVESLLASVARRALMVISAALAVAALAFWAWLMSLLAERVGGGLIGVMQICALVIMGALAVAVVAASGWAVLQAPQVRRRLRKAGPATTPPPPATSEAQ
jgi:hypothetical protein